MKFLQSAAIVAGFEKTHGRNVKNCRNMLSSRSHLMLMMIGSFIEISSSLFMFQWSRHIFHQFYNNFR